MLKVITEIKFKEKYPDKDLESEIEKRLTEIKQNNPKISDEEAKQQVMKELVDELDIHVRPSSYEKKSKDLLLSQYMDRTKQLFKDILLSKNPELAKDEKRLEDEISKLVEEYNANSKEVEDIIKEIGKIPAPYIEELEELNKLKDRLSSIKKAFLYDHKKIELISKLLQSNYDFDTVIDLVAELSDIYIPELEDLSKSLNDLNSKVELVASELNTLQNLISDIKEAGKELENIEVEEAKTGPSVLEKMREVLTPGQEVVPVPASLKNKIDIK
jgi:DNA repair exonuclease SbcCD ATPase subunit